MADVMRRVLALLAALQTGKAFSGDELATRLDVTPRTLRRDVDRLRGYGYPVETQPGPGGYYRLAAGRAMPPLLLDDDEAIATLLGLATLASTGDASEGSVDDAATRAYGKVDQFLPKRLRPRAVALRASLETTPMPAPGTSAEAMSTLAEAIHHRHVVTFDYAGATATASSRRVEPHRQIHLHLRWYLLAWDLGKADWRVFRTDRITGLQRLGQGFDPRPLPAGSGIDYLRQGLAKDKQRVVVTVDASVTVVADAFKYRDGEFTAIAENRTRVVLVLDTWQWLLQSLAFLDAGFTIDEPAEFREMCRRFGTRLVEQ
ncbi:helix-turn-helix transcriptional regulator [Kibdelosporangium phytohabitans]|uniref:Transcriptional regulator n=1 Tax=Kibdelosporangium phytohabitans TaxID=860235 RepID=A0A0N9I8B5_9PSEU|nr:YafY family protein [Kibdelosporangium phytohabitans]ALG10884.1 transcriptional regulator [Kibdelosporangium phytohabitans]MBE1462072.1 putative DNA-binding transcriptional regulator YafY [Kibdelosporangium phytohabitans]